MRILPLLLATLIATPALAQESQLHADLRREGDDLRESCTGGLDAKKVVGCVVTLATDDPFHVAVGSLAPQNGMGFGLGFAEHYTPNERWRLSFNADAVAATSGSYRAGLYVKFIHTPIEPAGGIVVIRPGATPPPPTRPVAIREYPVFNLYAQTISLDTLSLAGGLGAFGEKQTIIGGNVIYPLTQAAVLRPSLIGAVNGRFVNTTSPSLLLDQQHGFVQFEEGVRLKPAVFDNRLQLNYVALFDQFASSADAQSSFHRWTLDLAHNFAIYRTVSSAAPRDTNGPDECFQSVGSRGCQPISYSRNLEGSVGVRVLSVNSTASSGSSVPFYFQPTLGGSDINGQRMLSAFDDYRFRGPNLLALQESVEHSVWGPIGAYVLFEQGRVNGDGVGSDGFVRSYAVGLTLRAGGFPLVNLSFAWGAEGHHIIGSIDSTLLGGSSRPSLF